MIVRTYGRRNRGINRTYSDTLSGGEDDVGLDDPYTDSFSISQDTPQDFYNFTSQESSSLWASQESNHSVKISNFATSSENGDDRRSKKQKNTCPAVPLIPATSTLMEAQEFGEMMEHVDEVNFAIDGLKKASQVRIRRASLSSLLSICAPGHQRRLLRTHGMAKTIIDAISGLSFDDPPSNLAAAALFFVLTSDGEDDHLLESHSSIRFLIKLLKPIVSIATEDKSRKLGSKLLALRKDTDIMRDTDKNLDSSSSVIISKVLEILVSCKEMKPSVGDDAGMRRPELNPKWIALLTMEKACLSKISFEDTTGTVRKTGGDFKEKLRELGGLDAVFEVIMNCYSVMEGWIKHTSPSIQDAKHDLDPESLILILKCLKIMENATFLSKDNQSHLLGMKRSLDSNRSRLSFTELILSVIKILSDLYLPRSSAISADEKSYYVSDGSGHASELALDADRKADDNEVIIVSSSANFSSTDWTQPENSFSISQNSPRLTTDRLDNSESNSGTTTTSMNDTYRMKTRSRSALSGSCSGTVKSSSSGAPINSIGSKTNSGLVERSGNGKDDKCDLLEDSEDPFAFDEDAFEPSKWDKLYGKPKKSPKKSRTKKSGVVNKALEDGCQDQTMTSQQESINGGNHQQSSNGENHQQSSNGGNHQRSSMGERHSSHESSCSRAGDKENSTLLADCLLTAVKVLMNLANENPIGCRQIAECGGLETISSLIASHFPSFSSSLPHLGGRVVLNYQDDRALTEQELDFLVAILGLLVNLVEKDGDNRSRLAAARVPLPNSQGLEEESHREVIPLLCSIFLANRGAGDEAGEGSVETANEELAVLQGEKEAEKMIVEAYAALLLAFLSTESSSIRAAIADYLPGHNLGSLVPVLERFVVFHLTLNMITPETHKAVTEVIESCKVP